MQQHNDALLRTEVRLLAPADRHHVGAQQKRTNEGCRSVVP